MKKFEELPRSEVIQTLSRDEQGHLTGGFLDLPVISDSIDPRVKNKAGQCENINCSSTKNKASDGCSNSNCDCTCSQINATCVPNRLC